MRKLLASLLFVALFILSGAGAPFAQSPDARLAAVYPPPYPPTQGAHMLQTALAEAGIIRIEVLAAGALGAPHQMLKLVQDGVVQLALLPTEVLIAVNPDFSIFSLPFAFEDLGYVVRFQESETGKQLLRSLTAARLQGLAYWSVGMEQLFTKQPIRQADSFKGLKITGVGTPIARSVLASLGANTLSLGAGEIVAALERGVVDGSENTTFFAEAAQFGRFQKYMNITNQQYQGAVLVANAAFWNGLSADKRQATLAMIGDVTRKIDELAIDATARQVEALRKSGLEIVVPDAAAFKVWRGVATESWSKDGRDAKIVLAAQAGGTEGGGDTCGPAVCRCPTRTCSRDCCRRPR